VSGAEAAATARMSDGEGQEHTPSAGVAGPVETWLAAPAGRIECRKRNMPCGPVAAPAGARRAFVQLFSAGHPFFSTEPRSTSSQRTSPEIETGAWPPTPQVRRLGA
jgi:hypothetical protein